jgi:hypothetical protein
VAELSELENKMRAVMSQAKECVDMSLEIMGKDQGAKAVILKHWENFILHLFDYVKRKEKESGQDILQGVSLARFLKYLK